MENNIMSGKFKQGEYQLINPDKYLGKKPPYYRSSYELTFFEWADKRDSVLSWGSETVVIPYYNPVKKRQARYYVDIVITYVNKYGETITEIVEIKPMSQCAKPKMRGGKKAEQTYLRECIAWDTNNAKWSAAEKYARSRGWIFRIVTEESLFKRGRQ